MARLVGDRRGGALIDWLFFAGHDSVIYAYFLIKRKFVTVAVADAFIADICVICHVRRHLA